jgi:hypothetical protein
MRLAEALMTDPSPQIRGSLPEWAVIPIVACFLLVVFAFVKQHRDEEKGRAWVLTQLDQLSPDARVQLEGQYLNDPRPVLDALKSLSSMAAHHSHPTRPIHLAITDTSRDVELVVARDSERRSEYWVFIAGQRGGGELQAGREVGRITTSVFATEPP